MPSLPQHDTTPLQQIVAHVRRLLQNTFASKGECDDISKGCIFDANNGIVCAEAQLVVPVDIKTEDDND